MTKLSAGFAMGIFKAIFSLKTVRFYQIELPKKDVYNKYKLDVSNLLWTILEAFGRNYSARFTRLAGCFTMHLKQYSLKTLPCVCQ